jgi:hypothetical protein
MMTTCIVVYKKWNENISFLLWPCFCNIKNHLLCDVIHKSRYWQVILNQCLKMKLQFKAFRRQKVCYQSRNHLKLSPYPKSGAVMETQPFPLAVFHHGHCPRRVRPGPPRVFRLSVDIIIRITLIKKWWLNIPAYKCSTMSRIYF